MVDLFCVPFRGHRSPRRSSGGIGGGAMRSPMGLIATLIAIAGLVACDTTTSTVVGGPSSTVAVTGVSVTAKEIVVTFDAEGPCFAEGAWTDVMCSHGTPDGAAWGKTVELPEGARQVTYPRESGTWGNCEVIVAASMAWQQAHAGGRIPSGCEVRYSFQIPGPDANTASR